LAWQNFLKRLANKVPEAEAQEMLLKDIDEDKKIAKAEKISPHLFFKDKPPIESTVELKLYLNGIIQPEESRFAKLLHLERETSTRERVARHEQMKNSWKRLEKEAIEALMLAGALKIDLTNTLIEEFKNVREALNNKLPKFETSSEKKEAYLEAIISAEVVKTKIAEARKTK